MTTNIIVLLIGVVVGFGAVQFSRYPMRRHRPQKTMPMYTESGPYAIAVKIPEYAPERVKAYVIIGGIYPKALLDDAYVENIECNGQTYDPDAYPQLKEMLRDRFGINRVPDYRGRVIR